MNRGRLLALEGLDGCGKSTQIEPLADALRRAGHEVLATYEPTDGPHGRRIRELAHSRERVPPEEELRWFVEDRREHVAQVLEPALAAGRVVLTDRYYLSSVAYQGARGLDWGEILADSEREFPAPDLALLFEIDPAAGLARVRARGAPVDDRFERPEFLARVAEIFRALECPYVVRIDAASPVDAVSRAVRDAVRERLALL
ncbi:MAG TPA: dTMP kinase [Myxococcota bacterium]